MAYSTMAGNCTLTFRDNDYTEQNIEEQTYLQRLVKTLGYIRLIQINPPRFSFTITPFEKCRPHYTRQIILTSWNTPPPPPPSKRSVSAPELCRLQCFQYILECCTMQCCQYTCSDVKDYQGEQLSMIRQNQKTQYDFTQGLEKRNVSPLSKV